MGVRCIKGISPELSYAALCYSIAYQPHKVDTDPAERGKSELEEIFGVRKFSYTMTVIVPGQMGMKMSVDNSASDSNYTKENSKVETPPQMRKRKKKKRSSKPQMGAMFEDLYKVTGETLGKGSYGTVETCKNVFTGIEYAVKIIGKKPGFNRSGVLKEIEIYHLCRGQKNIIQLIEFFEEEDHFYLVFEKLHGGSLLEHIQQRISFQEAEASLIIKDLAEAITYLHSRGIAHRDIKPDNVLCLNKNTPCQVKLCDFDLSSSVSRGVSTPQLLTPVGTLEYMAPEVAEAFKVDNDDEEITYDKKCDLWSLGITMYILLCGYAPFSGNCGQDCGWERGESCMDCQELLFCSIKQEELVFPEQHWSQISIQAKSLIQHLLQKDSTTRMDAVKVLEHPWITGLGNSETHQQSTNLNRGIADNIPGEDDNSAEVTLPIDIP